MDAKQIWHTALGELQLQMTKATFDTWVKPTYAVTYDQGALVIGVHSSYAKEWLENRLHTTIQRTLNSIVGQPVEVKYVLHATAPNSDGSSNDADRPADRAVPGESTPTLPPSARSLGSQPAPRRNGSNLNPKLTFANYIVGNSNRLAHAACLSVAEKPSEAYNPLFLYGGTGLGKTHLLHALGHVPYSHGKIVIYISSETFTNELINSIRTQTTGEFRRAYREVDVLLIDDIQFIAGKETTQEEFFHTFNSLHAANKQIVISSDRHPRAIPTLEERLRSRFEGGLIVDIQPPDIETRIAILRSKAESQPIPVPEAIVDFLARKIQSNIRELEGALTRVVAFAQLMEAPLTVDLANAVLQDILRQAPITLDEVLNTVAEFYGIDLDEVKGRGRNREVVVPRQMAMYLLREETNASLPQIGEIFGRDHTTVMYSVEKMAEMIDTDTQRRREMLTIKERLYQAQRA